MKSFLIAGCSLLLGLSCATAANISSAGVDGADGGLLKVDQADPYWWFCVQPDGSAGPLAAGPAGYEANIVSLDYGWTRQTTERYNLSLITSQERKDDLVTQVNVIEYLLDTYLPWDQTTDRFLEKVATPASSTDQAANDDFFNNFYAVHEYVKALHGKLYDVTFTDLSIYDPVNPFPTDTAANIARNTFFENIKDEVNAKDFLNEFASYDPAHPYSFVNTFLPQGDKDDKQDLLIIGAIPEPTTGLLALGSLIALANRRRRNA